ncbi:MAG: transposase [Geminicoccaceae bacterium]|nr:transposase [Geminicoccaceae bacterium]
MTRLPRAVMPGVPHHVTQRGNRRQVVFFGDDDYRLYIRLVAECCAAANVSVWAWCLMPNHVHLVMAPATSDGLRASLARAHRRYTLAVNRRQHWSGYLWQGRFRSTPMDEPHALMTLRYIEQNPVRARLCDRPEDWPWSSARTHLDLPPATGIGDPLTDLAATRGLVGDWAAHLADTVPDSAADALRQHTRTGRPFGSHTFTSQLEHALARRFTPAKRGRPKRQRADTEKG